MVEEGECSQQRDEQRVIEVASFNKVRLGLNDCPAPALPERA